MEIRHIYHTGIKCKTVKSWQSGKCSKVFHSDQCLLFIDKTKAQRSFITPESLFGLMGNHIYGHLSFPPISQVLFFLCWKWINAHSQAPPPKANNYKSSTDFSNKDRLHTTFFSLPGPITFSFIFRKRIAWMRTELIGSPIVFPWLSPFF